MSVRSEPVSIIVTFSTDRAAQGHTRTCDLKAGLCCRHTLAVSPQSSPKAFTTDHSAASVCFTAGGCSSCTCICLAIVLLELRLHDTHHGVLHALLGVGRPARLFWLLALHKPQMPITTTVAATDHCGRADDNQMEALRTNKWKSAREMNKWRSARARDCSS